MLFTRFIQLFELKHLLPEMLKEFLGIEQNQTMQQVFPVLDLFKEDLIYFIEYPYIEKYYRDSYYNFYSRKHNKCRRNSLRISLFHKDTDVVNFFKEEQLKKIEEYFFGFITIRPTSYRILGHSFLSPIALKNNGFVACLCSKSVSVNGCKLNVRGFPYISQDNETITCSESALLNIMDYFGNRYSEYSIILPSQIAKILNRQTFQRQLPSRGLTTDNISFVLKKLGFGSRVYFKKLFARDEFKELLFTYIESGIPLIATARNKDSHHAIVVIGRKNIQEKISAKKSYFTKKTPLTLDVFLDDILIMNDNHTPYELVKYENPINDGAYEIISFIVPLYSKVHVEAYIFKMTFFKIIDIFNKTEQTSHIQLIPENNKYILRYFLTSSRTYKNYIAHLKNLSEDLRLIIIYKAMPKFIWVGEIIEGTELNKHQEVRSIVIIDATESGLTKHLIYASDGTYSIFYREEQIDDTEVEELKNFRIVKHSSNKFITFADNLKEA